ncbi:uncharacterized protein LOC119421224 [Nematolebias whitei]|uniref:uncharacterized protein LOC119421224 n=1 Tax=Nematolebias whitei TaxID=451745 RepID=UPI0018985F37|nr:uncharacterized protein LOC119421224 [Nematolebias whitei]
MDVREHVLSAGKAVLDMMEREWQPLSAGELEHRLDQAVEEILEADLVTKLETQTPRTVYVQLLQSKPTAGAQVSPPADVKGNPAEGGAAAADGEQETAVEPAAVRYISELLQSSTSRTRMAGRARLSPSHTVLLSLSLLSERISYRSVSRRFQLEKGNIHRIFSSFCERINALEEKLIRWPLGREAEETLFPFSSLLERDEQEDGVPLVLGVLGHTLVPVRLPAGKLDPESGATLEKMAKREAHPDSWLNLELVCCRRGRFLHCRISRGSDRDRGRTLRDRLRRHPELMPSRSCLVARSGYPLTAHVLTPYAGSRGPKEELFNRTLEELCQILDRAVAGLKARFKRLTSLDVGNHDRARAVVLTACVLHNVFVSTGRDVRGQPGRESAPTEEEEEEEEEGVRRRDAVADLLLKNVQPGNL